MKINKAELPREGYEALPRFMGELPHRLAVNSILAKNMAEICSENKVFLPAQTSFKLKTNSELS
jgi:hypothetical protein